MTYEQYWFGDPLMVRDYYEADRLRMERENTMAWLQGRYIYDALCAVAPILHAFAKKGTKPLDYMKEPYPMESKTVKPETPAERERREQNEAIRAEAYMTQMVAAGKNWGRKK